CPFNERLEAVMRVVNNHADKTGKKVLYAVNITDEIDQMWRNLDLMNDVGANCAMVCVKSVGLTGLRAVRDCSKALIHGHRAGWGVLSRSPDIGISFDVMQKLWRLAGVDHIHVNGLASKFTETDAVVAQSARSVQKPVCSEGGASHIAMPVYSSGQTAWQIESAGALLGNEDYIFCAGGGIMSHPKGASAGVVALKQAAEAARLGISIEEHALKHPELSLALETFKKPLIEI
ncbi:MAG: RuBisCO large subunit C-terminal-like domain-containing protein, partial [Nitratireductor sp.]